MVTISEDYRIEQQRLHLNPNYGVASLGFAGVVAKHIEQFSLKSVTDYGAGKQRLKQALDQIGCSDYEYRPYDPAFPEYGSPKKSDYVCCIDVLEHIEKEYLDNVLIEISKCTKLLAFLTIHTGPAMKTLSDGRNAHLIQEDTSWWLPKLVRFFEIRQLQTVQNGAGFSVLVVPRKKH